jgi:two-component system, NarL family, sensor histidine kinase UhpB
VGGGARLSLSERISNAGGEIRMSPSQRLLHIEDPPQVAEVSRFDAHEALRESEAIRRGILNSLLARVALVDRDGTIVAVNKAWNELENSASGSNYLRELRLAEECGNAFAGALADGILKVIRREKPVFSMEYEVKTASVARWHVARAAPLDGHGDATVVSCEDITEQALSRIALERANGRLQTISKRLLHVQEEDRRAISRELHDDIGQTLGALKIGLHRISSASASEHLGLVSGCLEAAEEALGKLRLLAMELRPPQLDQLGLQEALEWLAQRQGTASGLAITCMFSGPEARAPAQVEIACYRIAQEALNNATRHATAKTILIMVESDESMLRLVVRDDGVGFDEDSARLRVIRSGSMGLIGMEERAQLAGGKLRVRTAPGTGTTVIASFPLAEPGRESGPIPELATWP